MDAAKESGFDAADPEVIRALVWTPEQQLAEMMRRAVPLLTIMNTPISFSPFPTDVTVVTSMKSGTTWVSHICHQLRTKGREELDFEEQVPEVVAILEFSIPIYHTDPNSVIQPAEPRLFCSHLPYEMIPKGGRYIFCFRDQKDALYSLCLFVETMLILRGRVPLPMMLNVFSALQWTANNLRKLVSWWEHRHDDNVLFMFYDDLKEDHAGCVRRIAKFLGIDCDEETVTRVVHSTTHAVMSEHHSKFDLHSMVFKIAEGVGEEPPSTFIGRVRKDGGMSGDGRNLPLDGQQQIDEEWRTIVASKTGHRNLKEMREAWKEEMGRN